MVAAGWFAVGDESSDWERFNSKSKNCKRSLLAWHHKSFKNAAVEISKLKVASISA